MTSARCSRTKRCVPRVEWTARGNGWWPELRSVEGHVVKDSVWEGTKSTMQKRTMCEDAIKRIHVENGSLWAEGGVVVFVCFSQRRGDGITTNSRLTRRGGRWMRLGEQRDSNESDAAAESIEDAFEGKSRETRPVTRNLVVKSVLERNEEGEKELQSRSREESSERGGRPTTRAEGLDGLVLVLGALVLVLTGWCQWEWERECQPVRAPPRTDRAEPGARRGRETRPK